MDEVALINSAKDGDLDSFNRLVLAYQNLVYSQAYRMMGESDSAEDASQTAFISAFRKIHTFRGGSFKAWLLRIVTNACYDELRRRQRQPITSLRPTDDSGEEIESPSWLEDPEELPEEATQRAELGDAIQHCLDKLPANFRTVVVLVDIQGFDYAATSETIGTPLGTVKSRLARARMRMRDCLQDFWELLPHKYRLNNEGNP